MPYRSNKITFLNSNELKLSGTLEMPVLPTKAFAIFAHFFTGSKDFLPVTRICRELAKTGIAVLRFDFSGLGGSEGEFSNSNFTSNLGDIMAANDYLCKNYEAPQLLIGHSLGGAAMLSVAAKIPSAKAIVTIGSPSNALHVKHLFAAHENEILKNGQAVVDLAGREFIIKKQLLDDLSKYHNADNIKSINKALLIFHSPIDDTVDIEEAAKIYQAAKHPKSFISLDSANHLLTNKNDATYVANTIAAWSKRYVLEQSNAEPPKVEPGKVIVAEINNKFTQEICSSKHHWLADEPENVGGDNTGPNPYELLLSSLGACTSMTIRMYANKKEWKLDSIKIELKHSKVYEADCSSCENENNSVDVIERKIFLEGNLNDEQKQKILEIADKCPVSRTLHANVNVKSIIG